MLLWNNFKGALNMYDNDPQSTQVEPEEQEKSKVEAFIEKGRARAESRLERRAEMSFDRIINRILSKIGL